MCKKLLTILVFVALTASGCMGGYYGGFIQPSRGAPQFAPVRGNAGEQLVSAFKRGWNSNNVSYEAVPENSICRAKIQPNWIYMNGWWFDQFGTRQCTTEAYAIFLANGSTTAHQPEKLPCWQYVPSVGNVQTGHCPIR